MRAVSWPRDTAAVARSLARSDAWFWLDGSAVDPEGDSGLSYLGAAAEIRLAERGREQTFLQGLRGHRSEDDTGWVVALGYEFGVGLMGEDPAHDEVPPAFALRPAIVLVLDHARASAELRGPNDEDIDAWIELHGPSLEEEIRPRHVRDRDASPLQAATSAWRRSDERYLADVRSCKSAIHDGDAYVLCLTDSAEIAAADVDPLDLYRELVSGGSAIRGAIIVAGTRALVSASPERFLSKRGSSLATHPIKGTRPRGNTPQEDAILAEDLANDPKERAENLMIVDLMRNDLSRVCEPGTVHIDGFLRVEPHPRVHQLVSTIAGRMRAGTDALDAIEACFPGGSMTGAPKRRAVQLLAALEGRARGLYSGCFGWLDDGGDAELAMSIRCVELRGRRGHDQRALIGAGGGVTSDSDPRSELSEKQLKAGPLLAALRSAIAVAPVAEREPRSGRETPESR